MVGDGGVVGAAVEADFATPSFEPTITDDGGFAEDVVEGGGKVYMVGRG